MEASAERATVRIVSGVGGEGQDPEAAAAPVAPGTEPEALPPVPAAATGDDNPPAIGGDPAVPSPSPEDIVTSAGGGLADRMRARFQAIRSTEEFPIPGWELPNGEPGLIVEAKAFGDKKAFTQGVTNEVYIAKSTHRLWLVNDDGSREVIPGGWGPALAGMIGVKVAKASDLVAIVISKPDPDDPDRRIPNVTGIGTLAQEIVSWAGRGTRDAEEALGE